jgi:hypothetical protein
MNKKLLASKKGQTSVEYLFLIFVSISLGLLLFKKLNDYFLKNPDSFVNQQLSSFKGFSDAGGNSYKKFPLRLPK